jgi:hypothetical protein
LFCFRNNRRCRSVFCNRLLRSSDDPGLVETTDRNVNHPRSLKLPSSTS